jgi:Xaa-Pro aminopeptidase
MATELTAPDATIFDTRIQRVRELAKARGFDAVLAYKLMGDIYTYGGHGYVQHLTEPWLTLTNSPAFILVPPSGDVYCILLSGLGESVRGPLRLVADASMQDMSGQQVPTLVRSLREVVTSEGLQDSTIGLVRLKELPLWLHERLHAELPHARFEDATNVLDLSMGTKTLAEVAHVAETSRLADLAFETVFELARPGKSEHDVAVEAEARALRAGALYASIRVGSGKATDNQSSDRRASAKIIQPGDHLHVNFDLLCGGYWVNVVRRGVAGKATAPYRRLFDLVIEDEDACLAAMKIGATGGDVYRAQQKILDAAVADKRLSREHTAQRLGHGIGLENHERPILVPSDEFVIQENMTFALHPGLNVPGVGHASNGDIVHVTSAGARLITSFPRELHELD